MTKPLIQLLTLSAVFMAMILAVFVASGFLAHAFRRLVMNPRVRNGCFGTASPQPLRVLASDWLPVRGDVPCGLLGDVKAWCGGLSGDHPCHRQCWTPRRGADAQFEGGRCRGTGSNSPAQKLAARQPPRYRQAANAEGAWQSIRLSAFSVRRRSALSYSRQPRSEERR